MQGNIERGLFLGLFLTIINLCGCASTLHQDDLTMGSHMPVFSVVDPANDDFPSSDQHIVLRRWTYQDYPWQIVTHADWKMFFIVCCDSQAPKISYNWSDVAYYLANRDARTNLVNLFAFAHDQKLAYFLSKGDNLSTQFVYLDVFRESSSGGLVRMNRDEYRRAMIPNGWTKFTRLLNINEDDPTIAAFQDLPMEWLPAAPTSSAPRTSSQGNNNPQLANR